MPSFRPIACLALLLGLNPAASADEPFPVLIEVDASKPVGDLKPIWRFFGADEPNYATMKDGKELIGELGELKPRSVYFRAHNLLTTGDGSPGLKWGSTNAYTEDAQGRPVYDWRIVDEIFQAYLDRGVKPYAQVGFMPEAMSTKPQPYRHAWTPKAKYDEIYTGWAYPPKDYDRWAELVYRWVEHCVDRFGKAEVESWYWEVWNEPNIAYWRGTPEEFRKLHDHAVAAIRRALPTARVGGADSAGSGGRWTRDFLEHCLRGTNAATGKVGTPIDFVSFHAKGAPEFVDGHVRMGIANQLRTINDGFKLVGSFPELRQTPIVVGESDPDGCAACQGPQLGYRNGTMYSSYTAATFGREQELADRAGVNLEGALTWAFEFEGQPMFAGFRVLASNGIDLPVLNVFRMMSKMGGKRIAVRSDGAIGLDDILRSGVRGKPDVSALASVEVGRASILVWHYHDDDLPGPDAEVTINLDNFPRFAGAGVYATEYRVDADHGNAFEAWKRMGSPPDPSAEQRAALEDASRLRAVGEPRLLPQTGRALPVKVRLPRQGVALIEIHTNLPAIPADAPAPR